jgi:prepilin-type N-terminal cleavage/methylation domain-containing protein
MRTAERSKGQSGFSLPELLVAMTLVLLIMAAVLSQVKSVFQTSSAAHELTDAQQGLRFAQEYINRDLVTTGDGLRGINNIRLPLTFVQTYITKNPVTNPNDPDYVTLPVVISDDNVAAGTAVAGANPAVNILAGTDRITFLMIDQNFTPLSLPSDAINSSGANVSLTPQQLTDGNFKTGEIYFITSQYGATFGSITNVTGANGNSPNLIFSNSDTFGLNKPSANSGNIAYVSRGPNYNQAVPTSIMRMQMLQYFVNANGILIRRALGVGGGLGYADSTVAENVTDLQFRYFLNNTAQPVTQLTTSTQQTAVRQVEVSVSVRTAHAVVNSQRPVVSATTSTSVRNLQFREAL